MNRPIVAFLLVLVLYAVASEKVRAGDEAAKALAGTAAALIDQGRRADAIRRLQLPDQPLVALGAFDLLILHYYWQKEDLPVVVDLARGAIVYGRSHAESEAAAEVRSRILLRVKAIAYNLASFTWPGWGEEGIVVRKADREQGVTAADLNLRLAKKLDRGSKALSAAYWIVGAHQLTSGEPSTAAMSFERAKHYAGKAGDRPGELMNRGYIGVALALGGKPMDGMGTIRSAISQLEAEGSGDALFYAAQLADVGRRLIGADWRNGGGNRRIESGPVVFQFPAWGAAGRYHILKRLLVPDSPYRREARLHDFEELVLARLTSMQRDLDPWFYVPGTVDDAVFAAAGKGALSPAEAVSLSEVFGVMEERIAKLRAAHEDVLKAFEDSLRTEQAARSLELLAEFTGVPSLMLTIFAVPTPGEAAVVTRLPGSLVIEVPRGGDMDRAVIREVAFALLMRKEDVLWAAVDGTEGLSSETLAEGVALALVGGGPEQAWAQPLGPKLRKAMTDGDLETLLAEAVEAWSASRGK